MTSWAIAVRSPHAHVLAKIHDVPDVRVGEHGQFVWARGTGTESDVERILAKVPSSRLFEVVHEDRLRPKGRLLPIGRLPDVRWVPLREWLTIDIPIAAVAGTPGGLAELRLVVDAARPGEVLLLSRTDAFREFLLEAPLHRLRPLRFVVNDARAEVLVRGQPLPSIPGEHFVLAAGVATPAGRRWSPPVGASVVRAWLGASESTVIVWRADGGISEVDEDGFAPASRRAGRKL